MLKDIVEITDQNDSVIKIVVDRALWQNDHKWRTLENGVWVTNAGGAKFSRPQSIYLKSALCLSNTPTYSWTGVCLYDYRQNNKWGFEIINQAGNGWMTNGWSYNTGYGEKGYTGIKWRIVG